MHPDVQKRIEEGYCFLCATENFQHKELCTKNPNRPIALHRGQIQIGGVYRYKAAPRSIVAPNEGVVKVQKIEASKYHGDMVYLYLQSEDGSWIHEDKGMAYVRGTFYDFEFFKANTPASDGERGRDG